MVANWAAAGVEEARSDCRERHEVKMLPMAVCVESAGGLAGGVAKRADWSRVRGGCDESQESADGMSMVYVLARRRDIRFLLDWDCCSMIVGLCCIRSSSGRPCDRRGRLG